MRACGTNIITSNPSEKKNLNTEQISDYPRVNGKILYLSSSHITLYTFVNDF